MRTVFKQIAQLAFGCGMGWVVCDKTRRIARPQDFTTTTDARITHESGGNV
jgi:hypothetical protein